MVQVTTIEGSWDWGKLSFVLSCTPCTSNYSLYCHVLNRHRINTSDFKPLDFLANKFVLEVACGYQHCICRAIDREQLRAMASAGENTDEVVVGSSFGADAYVWGNGTLGQLGLGTVYFSYSDLLSMSTYCITCCNVQV